MTVPALLTTSRRPPGHSGDRGLGRRPGLVGLVVALVVALLGAVGFGSQAVLHPPLRIGAVFPLTGDPDAVALAGQERLGVRIAADLANADGGVGGRPIELVVRDLPTASAATSAVAGLKADGVPVVIGAYSSDLSMAASSAADAAGLVYWEAGAVADRLTGRGLPFVFRVGADGARLGTNSAQFATTELAPRLGIRPADLRVAVVAADDAYASSVADAATAEATALGLHLSERVDYDLNLPRWPEVMARLAAERPDVVILASHIPDGVAFVQALQAAHLRVGALIGSTMAECVPDFGNALGDAALGIFGSDRPPSGFDPSVLAPAARAVYERFAAAWAREVGGAPSEEGLSGFSAAWALFHDVVPVAAASGRIDPGAIAAASRAIDLPAGSLPNGAGLRFATDPAHLGQNLRAAAVMWQWQPAGTVPLASGWGNVQRSAAGSLSAAPTSTVQDVVVWPAAFAAGEIRMVPLP